MTLDRRKIICASSWWFVLRIGESTLAGYLSKRHHLWHLPFPTMIAEHRSSQRSLSKLQEPSFEGAVTPDDWHGASEVMLPNVRLRKRHAAVRFDQARSNLKVVVAAKIAGDEAAKLYRVGRLRSSRVLIQNVRRLRSGENERMKPGRLSLAERIHKFARRVAEPLGKPVIDELRKANLPFRESGAVNPLLAFGRRHFSQHDEDGILLEILRRLGPTRSSGFLEFGVGNGTENNTIILLALGWRGAWVGGEDLAFQLSKGSRLAFLKNWITRDNAADLAKKALANS